MAMRRDIARNVLDWESVNERIIKLRFHNNGTLFTILGVYAPTDCADTQEKDEFFDCLANQVSNINSTDELVILGDLNGRITRKLNSRTTGRYANIVQNDNGCRVETMCEQCDLELLNTIFPHKEIHRITWCSHNQEFKSVIDYTIMRQNRRCVVLDSRDYRSAYCGSDHFMLVKKLQCVGNYKHQYKKRAPVDKQVKYNTTQLKDENTRWLYNRRLDEHLKSVV